MSYDITIGEFDGNYTSNVGPMFRLAVGSSPAQWNGKPAAEVEAMCGRMAIDMIVRPEAFAALDPPNGWGDSISLRNFVLQLLDACRKYPTEIVKVYA